MKLELSKEELNFLNRELKEIYENNYFKGNWEDFYEFSTCSKKVFEKELKILDNLRNKLKGVKK